MEEESEIHINEQELLLEHLMQTRHTNSHSLILQSQLYPFKFWDALDKSITDQPVRLRPNLNMYPSEASALICDEYGDQIVIGGCNRKAWLRAMIQRMEATNIKPNLAHVLSQEPFTPKQLWKFAVSKYTEIAITEEAKRAGCYFTNSERFKWELPFSYEKFPAVISGELDLAIFIPAEEPVSDDDKNIVGIEVKSISGYKGPRQVFGVKSLRSNNWIQKPEPKSDHLLQAILYYMYYVVMLKKYKYWKLAYINREDGSRSEFDLDLVEEHFEDDKILHRVYVNGQPYKYALYAEHILQRYQELHNYLEEEKLPPRDYELLYSQDKIAILAKRKLLSKKDQELFDKGKKIKKGDWNCSYCPFKNICYTDNGSPRDLSTISERELDLIEISAGGEEDDSES